ncbi:hypothetical protein [Aridibaculum aurantiacum]|uniref:hypothetical protein n=1 Tax=Aridibaculum aurantiacum TaxID=2810307 RepID=UPI001A96D084|nr:hypothetical protein [Aridibaculum aurantiacum]
MAEEKYEDSPGQPTPGENDPKEAIDTPKEVEEANDPNIDEDFPGYPHYPAKEDLLNPENNNGKVDLDVESFSRSNAIDPLHIKNIEGTSTVDGITAVEIAEDDDNDIGIVPGTEADVTAEDLALLGPRDADMDMGEDEELAARGWKPKAGTDLDIPDADMNDVTGDAMGQGDEENSYYSLGSDNKDALEENTDNNF